MNNREFVKALPGVFAASVVEGFRITHGGKYPMLEFDHGGRPHKIPFPGRSGDSPDFKHKLSYIKSYLRKLDDQHSLH